MTEPYRDTGPRHRPRRAGRGKLDVLHGARRVIALRGADATRFRDVADETGSAVSTLQYSFGSRGDSSSRPSRRRPRPISSGRGERLGVSGAVAQLRALVCESVIADSDDATRAQWLVWVEYWRAAARDSELRAGSADVYARWRTLVGGILTDGRAAGDFRRDLDTDQAAIQVLALLDGVGVPVVLEHPGMTSTRAAAVVLDALAAILGCEALRSEPT